MTTERLDLHVTDWAEVLYSIVPQGELNNSYLAAMRNPDRKPEDKKFPLKVQEVLDAYRSLAVSNSTIQPTECEFCKRYVYDPTEYLPCPFHRRKES